TLQSSVNDQFIEVVRRKKDSGPLVQPETVEWRRLKTFKNVIAQVLADVRTADDIEITPAKIVKGEVQKARVMIRGFDTFVPFTDLSLGYQITLTWILDLAWQLTAYYSESENPLAEPAIVLVDEIDLHLHPHWQWTIMKKLSGLFPKIQFIATSHS